MSRLIEKLDDEEKLLPSDDGYCVYWAEGGYMTADNLREIASELDRRNKTWHEQVMQDVGIPMPKIKPLVWEDYNRTPVHANIESRTPFGRFMVTVVPDGAYVPHCPFHVHPIPEFKSEDDAKAWCEQEYERRVRECLE